MKSLEFSNQDQALVNSLMGSLNPDSPIYMDMLEKRLAYKVEEFVKRNDLASGLFEAVKLLHWKVASYRADIIIDQILADPELKTASVKGLSLKKTKKTSKEVAAKIIKVLRESDAPLSRKEIADRAGLRLSTVCGTIKPLLDDQTVSLCGTKFDNDSQRIVETLVLKNE